MGLDEFLASDSRFNYSLAKATDETVGQAITRLYDARKYSSHIGHTSKHSSQYKLNVGWCPLTVEAITACQPSQRDPYSFAGQHAESLEISEQRFLWNIAKITLPEPCCERTYTDKSSQPFILFTT
jgi:hypothetical protein